MYHVLIVDDEPIVSVTIKSLIPWEDYHISMAYEAHNGKQALNLLEDHPEIDIVITDISMPVMSWITFGSGFSAVCPSASTGCACGSCRAVALWERALPCLR